MLNLLAGIFITIIILYFSSVCVRCGKVQTHQRRVRLLVPRTGTNEDVELDSARDTATSEMMPRFTQVVLVFPQPVVSEPPEFELLSVSIPYNYQKKKMCVCKMDRRARWRRPIYGRPCHAIRRRKLRCEM